MISGMTAWHTLRYALGMDKASTQTSSNEREALRRYAVKSTRAVEIGVFEGATTAELAHEIKAGAGGVLYAVDPFFPGRIGICWGEIIARMNVRRSGASDVVVFVKELSTKACQTVEGDFDFIFIDGDHSLDGIKRDWDDWSGRVQVGGIMALHDTKVPMYNPRVGSLGSYQYFESHIRKDARFELLEQIDSLSVLRRV